jgi:hypothetical protein
MCVCLCVCVFVCVYAQIPTEYIHTHTHTYIQYVTAEWEPSQWAGNHLEICLLSSQKNRNSLTWVLVALIVCFTYPVLYRFSAESRAGEWEL